MTNSLGKYPLAFIKKHKTIFAIIIITLIASFFRLWQISQLPGGLFPDEAANGIDVNSILQGDRSPFFEKGNGREGLFFYLLAISVEFFGRGPWQHHIVSAIAGIAEVIVLFFLARRMFGFKTAALASFFMAVSAWHIVLSRTAFRAIMIPLFTTLTFYYIVRFIQSRADRQKIYSAILAGAFFALGFYTYIAYRMMPVILGFLLLALLYAKYKNFPQMRGYIYSWKKYLACFAVAFAIFISPLAHYFWTHPGSFVGRSGQVSVFTASLNHGDLIGTILTVAEKTALSFFTEGDLNWRHNVSGMPFLPPAISIFFLAGLIYALWRSAKYIYYKTDFRDGKYLILTFWFFAMLVPELTTAEGIPHGLRLVGAIPAVFIFPAIILAKIIKCARNKFKNDSIAANLLAFALAFYIALIFTGAYNAYFINYANSPEAYYAYRSDLTAVGNYLNARNNKAKTYLSLDAFSEQTILYFTTLTNNPYQLVLPEKSYDVRLAPGDQIIFTQSTLFDIAKFKQYHPEARLAFEEKNKFGEIIMEVYEE
ncbi:glycosyltransferase family 39 protein [Patescibacteria group bacterium]|nr:glycosyltransferase family 39 protein [Patescibacteria group bacterium]